MFQAQLQISDQDLRTVQSQTQPSGLPYSADISLGQQGATRDNRLYVFGLNNSSTAAVAGNLQTAVADVANHITRTLTTAVSVGSTAVLVPIGNTAATQSQYAGGYLTVVSGPGAGISYKIKDNNAAAGNGTITVTLSEKEPVLVALTSSSVVSLYPCPWNNFIISSTTIAANNIIGVPNVAVPASNYAWLQVNGYCSVLSDGAITKGAYATPSSNTAGAALISSASVFTQVVGYAPELTITGDYQPLVLQVQ